jgi:hypothetical protein
MNDKAKEVKENFTAQRVNVLLWRVTRDDQPPYVQLAPNSAHTVDMVRFQLLLVVFSVVIRFRC